MGRFSIWMLPIVALSWSEVSSTADAAGKQGATYRRNRGRIVFQQAAFTPASTEKAFGKQVSKARRNKALKANAKGQWPFHFIAFMNSAPRAGTVNLVFYRIRGKREQVDFTEFTVAPKEVTLQANVVLKPLAGFKKGDRLQARVTRLIRGREKVYARCNVTLR